MKYLVIGGAGFIGSNLSKYLLEKDHEVIICDNLHTGSKDNISGIIGDITYHEKNCNELKISEVDGVGGIYHMGIYSSSPMYKNDYTLVGKVVNEFLHVMSLAKALDAKVVWASTSSIYNGNPTPWKEDMPAYVKDYYGEARYYLERLAKLHHDWYGVNSIAMRFFSVYGPNEEAKKQYANLVSQFLWDMRKGVSPILYGDGEQRRDFIFVRDVIRGLELAMESNIENDVFNLGTGKTTSLLELVDILNDKLSTNIEPSFVENTIKGYVQETQADTKKAKALLNFEYNVSLDEGIGYLIDKVD
ncbi:MAG TPA: NAD-dependent epimerase/dehydratase family protein [Candidatus Methanofastidiosa archaeon]|nr:NAD-dependent epimerase/dehydratase family protein [Candidatus Methanofastidiosa archaeon]